MTSKRFRTLLASLFLLVTLVVVAGCTPPVDVPPAADQAIAAGKAKEQAAEQASKAGSKEAAKLWGEAASYYAAVEHKFPGQSTGLQAAMAAAHINDEKLDNTLNAWTQLRNVLKQYASVSVPEKAEADRLLEQLAQKQGEKNAKSPFFKAMDLVVHFFGNNPRISPVLAIFAIAIFVTGVLWPLRYKTFKAGKEMQKYAPEIQKIQKEYKDDPLKLQEKMREFQQQHGVNPMAGCLPAMAQIPVFLLMIQLISNYQFHFRNATFLWINPDTAAASLTWPAPLTGALAHHLGEQDLLLLLLYAITMFVQMKIAPPPSDPTQAEQQKMMTNIMPVVYFVMMLNYQLPSAFVLYYFSSNLLSMGQQALIYRRLNKTMGVTLLAPAASGAPDPASSAPLAANEKLISPKNRKKK